MNTKPYEPDGVEFFDQASGRQMILITEDRNKGWICFRHPGGQWVTLREATAVDRALIAGAQAGKDSEKLCKLIGHTWEDDGERCMVCGIKDWMVAGRVCDDSDAIETGGAS